ncbi:uncharacterized protein RBU57_012628 [Macrochelys suwanniensis]
METPAVPRPQVGGQGPGRPCSSAGTQVVPVTIGHQGEYAATSDGPNHVGECSKSPLKAFHTMQNWALRCLASQDLEQALPVPILSQNTFAMNTTEGSHGREQIQTLVILVTLEKSCELPSMFVTQ